MLNSDDHFPMPPGVRDEYATSDSEGEPAGPMGDNFLRIPEDVLEHWADPLLFNSNSSDARLKAVNQNDGGTCTRVLLVRVSQACVCGDATDSVQDGGAAGLE